MHERLLRVRNGVIGHSDARHSETRIVGDSGSPYITLHWAAGRPFASQDLAVVETMIQKLVAQLRRRLESLLSSP